MSRILKEINGHKLTHPSSLHVGEIFCDRNGSYFRFIGTYVKCGVHLIKCTPCILINGLLCTLDNTATLSYFDAVYHVKVNPVHYKVM